MIRAKCECSLKRPTPPKVVVGVKTLMADAAMATGLLKETRVVTKGNAPMRCVCTLASLQCLITEREQRV